MITTLVLNPAVDKIYFVENFDPGKMYRVSKFVKSAGGKGINVARVAAILGEKVCAAGFKAGEPGEWLERQLKMQGVRTTFIEVEGESRTNSNIIDVVNGTETELLEMGPEIKPYDIKVFLDAYNGVLGRSKVLSCSGSLPIGVPKDFYNTLIDVAHSYNIKVILDTSGEMLKNGIEAKPYMVKPNLRELSTYSNRELNKLDDIIEVSRQIISKGVEFVVASMGSQGALLVSANEVLHAQKDNIQVVNAIGSGDSMVAGLAVGINRGYGVEDMLRLGVSCALANTQYAEIGMVDTELVEKYINEIKLKRL